MIAGITIGVYLHARQQADRALRDILRARAATLSGILEVEDGKHEFDITPRSVPEFMEPGSGTYAVIVNHVGKLVVRSPSLGDQPLPVETPWRAGEFLFDEIEDGPDGIPCATVTCSFVARSEERKKGEEDDDASAEEDLRFRIRVALDRRPRDRQLGTLAIFLGFAGLGALGVTLAGGLLVARRVLRPLRRMTEEAAALTPQDTSRRLGPDTVVGELDRLASTLNSALDRLGDALERQRRFTSDAGHELRTPVSVLLGNAELLLRKERTPEEYREGLERQHRTAKRMREITENLLTLARADADEAAVRKELVRPADLLGAMCEEFRALAAGGGVRIHCRVDDEVCVVGDPGLLDVLVQNLLGNACKFTPEGGRVDVVLEQGNGGATLVVADTGPGIPPEVRERVFDRFYRVHEGKDHREGAGLGLSIVAWVVRAHGGTIRIDANGDSGARFEVRLPLARA
ncbi:MAG: ATP-binding protein [Planctomycetota bacterium]